LFPKPTAPVDPAITQQGELISNHIHNLFVQRESWMKPKKGDARPAPTKLTISVAKQYPSWRRTSLEIVKSHIAKNPEISTGEMAKLLSADASLGKFMKRIVPWLKDVTVRQRKEYF